MPLRCRATWLALFLVVPTLTLVSPSTLFAQFDPNKSPIEEPPLARYAGSELEPFAIFGDNSDFDVDNNLSFGQSFFHDLDIAGNFLFAAAGRNFEIYNVSSVPNLPNLPTARVTARTTLPFWGNADGGGSFFVNYIRAATDDLVAIGVEEQGFSIWNTTTKNSPRVYYQDKGVVARQLHLVQDGSTHWAFVAHSGSGGGLIRYNVSAATSLNRCLDESPVSTSCGSVYQGEVGTFSAITALAGAGDFVGVIPPGVTASRITLYNMSNPLNPLVRINAGTLGTFPDIATDIAMWQSAGKLYLAAQFPSTTKIYDLSCALAGSCSLPSPIRTLNTPDPTSGNETTISASSTGARDFLYIGNSRRSGCAPQREYLFDVTSPSAAFDISPSVDVDGYWGWYYMDCTTGFNNIKPWRGYFHGDTFYRAAHSGLDAHRLAGGSPPIASFTCAPTNPFVGQTVACTDTSTGAPDQWSWTFQDATPSTSMAQNPSIVFSSAGGKQVTLVSTNSAGSSNTAMSTVNVVDPAPDVASVSSDVSSALNCSQVTFTAQGATGQTPLTFDWEVKNQGGKTEATGMGNPFMWDVAPGLAAGDYTATVTVDNAVGPPALATSGPVTISALPALAFTSGPDADPFTGSTVQFHVEAAGATEWNWNFGDGTITGFISDPIAGPNPQHTYTLSGNYDVTVQVRNCVEGPLTSNPLNIDVTVEPLDISSFRATCPLGFCFFDSGEVVNFTVNVLGTPQSYEFDWDGDGDHEEISATPLTQHIFCAAGSFEPVLRVRRGLDLDVLADTNSSALQIATAGSCSAPLSPTTLVATPLGNAIALTWIDRANNETGYRVLRRVDVGQPFLPIATLPANSNGFSDTAVDANTLYTYQIQVFSLTGVGDSNQSSATLSTDIFADSFESGDLSAWSSSVGDS